MSSRWIVAADGDSTSAESVLRCDRVAAFGFESWPRRPCRSQWARQRAARNLASALREPGWAGRPQKKYSRVRTFLWNALDAGGAAGRAPCVSLSASRPAHTQEASQASNFFFSTRVAQTEGPLRGQIASMRARASAIRSAPGARQGRMVFRRFDGTLPARLTSTSNKEYIRESASHTLALPVRRHLAVRFLPPASAASSNFDAPDESSSSSARQ